jgi:hypothetical protein
MAILLVINLLASVVMFGLSIHRATGEGCAAHFYPATIPTMVQAGLGAIAAIVGLGVSRLRFLCLAVSSAALGLLGFPAFYAMLRWPGGDDGGGLGWLFIVGGGCFASFVIAGMTMLIGLGYRGRITQPPSPLLSIGLPVAADGSVRVPLPGVSESLSPTAERRTVSKSLLLWAILATGVAYLIWCAAGPVSWTTTESESHVGGIQVRTTLAHELCPYPVPFYHHVATRDQTVLVDGQKWFRTGPLDDLRLSPTGEYAAVQLWEKPIQIWSKSTRESILLDSGELEKEFPGHSYTYPFRFDRWDGDSAFLVTVSGWDLKLGDYKQTWRVDAATGARTQAK